MANNKNYKSHKELLRFYDDIKSGLHKDEDSVWQQSGKMLNAETYKRIKNKKVRDLIEKKDREKFINDAKHHDSNEWMKKNLRLGFRTNLA